MRDFGIKLKLAKEFVGFMGSSSEFRSLFEKKNLQYHNTYSALEIKKARLQLLGIDLSNLNAEPKLPPIINFRMAKGGTGKTTLCGSVASTLSMFGYRVLMIDGDPQASLTGLFGINWVTENIMHIGELMLKFFRKEDYCIKNAIRPLYEGNMLDLIASDISLVNADSWLMGVTNREFLFKKFLDANLEFFNQYDVIMIDSAPSTNLLTNTFMCACQKILAVVWLDGQSLKAMQVLVSNVNELNDAFNYMGFHLDVHIVANGYHPSYGPCKDAMSTLISTYPDKIINTVIPHAVSFIKQVDLFKEENSGTVLEREPNSIATRAIIDLSKSLIKEYDIKLSGIKVI